MISETKDQPTIWAVGGGKGGTGKSFLAASLAIELGARGRDVVLIDADLGGPNLHTLLAVKENGNDLGDFVNNRIPRLEEAALATPYPGLKLIRGSESSLFLANLNHYKKLKLIRQIKSLPAERLIVDLGTGSAFNTLDLFVIAKPGIMVVTPEPTAVENTYHFLKSCAVRIMKLYAQYFKIQDFEERIRQILERPSTTLRAFLENLALFDGSAAQILTAVLRNFKPYLVLNKTRNRKDSHLGRSIVDVVRKYFLIDIGLLGEIPYDERVHWSLNRFVPFVLEYPQSAASQAIVTMADRLVSPSSMKEPETQRLES